MARATARRTLEPILEHRKLDLVAIGARGSARSKQIAKLVEVPLFTDDRALVAATQPDAAIVAVPDADAIILRLLKAGIHVLAEHPVTSSLATKAAKHAAVFAVNAHFWDLPAPRKFLVLAAGAGRPQAVVVDVHARALYSALDILDRALGGLALEDVRAVVGRAADAAYWPAAAVVARNRNVPISIQIPGAHKTRDDSRDHVVGHRISVGFARETITLVDTFGPVVRTPKHAAPTWRVADESSTITQAVTARKQANVRALAAFVRAAVVGARRPRRSPSDLRRREGVRAAPPTHASRRALSERRAQSGVSHDFGTQSAANLRERSESSGHARALVWVIVHRAGRDSWGGRLRS